MTTLLSPYSTVFALAAELYRRHVPDDRGRCRACWVWRCPVRVNSAGVILAAGVDPETLDPPPLGSRTDRTVPLDVLRVPRRSPGHTLR
jgi:hypothetical protein